MRKTLIAAGAAALAVSGAGVAYAQTAAPAITVKSSVSPSKAGTKHKPAPEKFSVTVTNNVGESKATASQIKITFPSTLKLSTKGLPQCTKSDQAIINAGGPQKACKKSIAGSGSAHVLLGNSVTGPPFNGSPFKFTVTPMVGKNQMLYYLPATPITVPAVLHGRISGRTQTISILTSLQQPSPGLYAAIMDLTTTISLKKGKHSLVTSTGCSGGGHTIKVSESFAPNPTAPVASTATSSGKASCKK